MVHCTLETEMKTKQITLESDEGILVDHKASHPKQGRNLAQALFDTLDEGNLILTNKRVIFHWGSGLFAAQHEELSFPIDSIKVIDGLAQVKPAKSERADSSYQLTFFLTDHQETFYFPTKTPASDVKTWIQEINRLLTGEPVGWNPHDVGFIDVARAFETVTKGVTKAAAAAKSTTDQVAESAIPIAKNAFEAAKPLIPVAAAAASAMPSPAGKFAGAVLGTIGSIGAQESTPDPAEKLSCPAIESSSDSLDAKIGQIKKLKELLDCGVLTQEEFDSKKKELLGL